jgi:predicted component of type VI protein secretion system
MIPRMKRGRIGTLLCGSLMIIASLLLIAGCSKDSTNSEPGKTVPHEGRWGIYELNPASQDVRLIYSTDDEMNTSALRLNS